MLPSLRPPSAITYDGKGLSYEDDLNGLWFAGHFERNTQRPIRADENVLSVSTINTRL